jgi:hypothetical protein
VETSNYTGCPVTPGGLYPESIRITSCNTPVAPTIRVTSVSVRHNLSFAVGTKSVIDVRKGNHLSGNVTVYNLYGAAYSRILICFQTDSQIYFPDKQPPCWSISQTNQAASKVQSVNTDTPACLDCSTVDRPGSNPVQPDNITDQTPGSQ